jgi:hypothetical protein
VIRAITIEDVVERKIRPVLVILLECHRVPMCNNVKLVENIPASSKKQAEGKE